jgi:hypothetical protein
MGMSPARRRPPVADVIDRLEAGIAPSLTEFRDLEAWLIDLASGADTRDRNAKSGVSNAVSLRVEPELVLALRQALARAAGIKAAFVHGAAGEGKQNPASEIELMVIGDATYADCFGGLHDAENLFKRRIRANFVTEQEWRCELRRGNLFFTTINAQPKIFIFASADDLMG